MTLRVSKPSLKRKLQSAKLLLRRDSHEGSSATELLRLDPEKGPWAECPGWILRRIHGWNALFSNSRESPLMNPCENADTVNSPSLAMESLFYCVHDSRAVDKGSSQELARPWDT